VAQQIQFATAHAFYRPPWDAGLQAPGAAGSASACSAYGRGEGRLSVAGGAPPWRDKLLTIFNSPRVHFMRNVLAHACRSGRRVVSAFIER
jgi:hypothetical protein